MRRVLLLLVLLPALCQSQKKVTDEEVRRVHRSAIVIDTHSDTTSRTVTGFDIGKRSDTGHMDIPRMREGGLGAQFFAVFVNASYERNHESAHRALEMADTVLHDIVGRYPDTFELAVTAADIERIHKRGKIAALMGIEGGHAIEDSLRLLRDFYLLGVRYMTLTHGNTNNWADSSGDLENPNVKHHNGLTDFGKEVVREMNRLGMMVDISHVSDKTFYDALEASRAPVIASHSSCRALSGIPRNMTDEMIRALAKKGGVIQINFGCDFLSQKAADASPFRTAEGKAKLAELQKLYADNPQRLREEQQRYFKERYAALPRATLDDLVAHIDHVVKLVGADYVGLGSDFDGVGCVPAGMDDVSKLPNLTRALLERDYSAADIRKVLGGNLLRVMRRVEEVSREGSAPGRR